MTEPNEVHWKLVTMVFMYMSITVIQTRCRSEAEQREEQVCARSQPRVSVKRAKVPFKRNTLMIIQFLDLIGKLSCKPSSAEGGGGIRIFPVSAYTTNFGKA